jgi:hypothetical protein
MNENVSLNIFSIPGDEAFEWIDIFGGALKTFGHETMRLLGD